ncbi:MAG: HNH endonuclease [Candidatus Vecturithrix sp.]|nr:HNH endonuclease [Candidatus Vecturithrix sp.]
MTDPRIKALSCIGELICRRMLDQIALSDDLSITCSTDKLHRKIFPSISLDEFEKEFNYIQYPGFEIFTKLPNGRLQSDLFEIDVSSENGRRLRSPDWAIKRFQAFLFDDFTCQYCGAKTDDLECDHIIPVVRGGGDEFANLITACARCNRSKGSKTMTEWIGQ